MNSLIKYLPTNIKLSNADVNLLNKIADAYSVKAHEDVSYGRNPMTGATMDVNPTVAALVEFIHTAYANYARSTSYTMTYNTKRVPINLFDRIKYLVLKLDRRAYGELID
jgi:hypothetical protein